ncbi:molecular chaperone DnaK [Candidatus Shapirobacteria bacterium]|nr:molecular chaperone DnaK [Candidatus Shapirobacteria bacterium]
MGKIIGIDLGTTNSCVAIMEAGKPKVISSAEGGNLIPSVVEPAKGLVGDLAKRQMVLNPKNTIYSIKRLMGRRYKDKEIEKTKTMVPYEIVSGKDNMAAVKIGGKVYTPQEISAKILQKAKADAEAFLGEEVKEAVVTVPAYFDDSQRQATKQAGEIAGLEVKRIINEPTAAALAYGLDKKHNQTIAIYDLGGGTFDISILEIGDGVFEVKATNGDTFLGGDDFDRKIVEWLVEEFKKSEGIDLSKDLQAMQRIREAAEKAKVELSTVAETDINLPFLVQRDNKALHLEKKLTRSKLEQMTDELIERSMKPVEACMKDAKLKPADIDEVILVGGQTRMPKVQKRVSGYFGKEPNKSVNPDEVVAVGAAIQGAVLGGEVRDVLLLDVTPLTLGIETLGQVRTPLIERNTTVPTKKSQIFSTAADNQTQVEINVLQGERPMAADNKSLGRFVLDGIPSAPRGMPQIEVTFDIDSNGILNVSAQDKATGKEQKISIQNATNLSNEEVEKMKEEAEKHAAEDEEKKAKVESKNNLDNAVFGAEKMLTDLKDKLEDKDKEELEKAVKESKELLGKEEAGKEEHEEKTQSLSALTQSIGSKIHQAAQSAQSPQGETEEEGKKEKKKNGEETKEQAEEGEIVN